MWVITKDFINSHPLEGGDRRRIGTGSKNYKLGAKLPFKFRMLDDDGEVYYEGRSSSDSSFDPLDDFGTPNDGCTTIQYWNNKRRQWEAIN